MADAIICLALLALAALILARPLPPLLALRLLDRAEVSRRRAGGEGAVKRYVLVFRGDNDALHREALEAAVKAAEEVNKTPVYRAWIEKGPDYTPGRNPWAERAEEER